MALLVTSGFQLSCSFGTAPSAMIVLPTNKVLCSSNPAANIMDNVSMVNILPFALCTSMANPAVAAAAGAPMPCIPVIPGPWIPGSPTVLLGGKPAVSHTCKLMCAYAGVIQISAPAQTKTLVP